MSTPTSITQRAWVAILVLTVITVAAFAVVARLVERFTANEKAIARHVFAHGMEV